jgi:hypothetical protein
MLGIVPSGCVYSFDMYVFRVGDEILVADGGKIVERLTAAYRLAMSIEQVRLFSPSSGGGRRRSRRGGCAESVFLYFVGPPGVADGAYRRRQRLY